MNDKTTGSFYTPLKLVNYMVEYIQERDNPESVLEPSAGDGRFVPALEKMGCHISLVESDQTKANQLKRKYKDRCLVYLNDFLDFSVNSSSSYDLIIGNPPYISKKAMKPDQREKAQKIIKFYNLDHTIFQNIWVLFLLGSIKLLSNTGSIFFVLPFEFLQVHYAEKLRNFLEAKFNTIEITTFEERVFSDIEQDVCLVYLSNKPNSKPYIQYRTIISECNTKETFCSMIMRNKPLSKWSNCIINDEETEKLLSIAHKFKQIKSFGEISPGIVTGANSFFALSKMETDSLEIPDNNRLPILMKSSCFSPLLVFTNNDYNTILQQDNTKCILLHLQGWEQKDFPKVLKTYLKKGKKHNIHKRYKCKNRRRWYDVPIVERGEVCFFKRFSLLPRIIVNSANVYTTDIAYNIRFLEGYDPKSFAFCFYNSLTLALCEYTGRFYGGGVGELVPSEFKSLYLPYKTIDDAQIETLDKMLRKKENIENIIDFVDKTVLSELDQDDAKLLHEIRSRYISRRIK